MIKLLQRPVLLVCVIALSATVYGQSYEDLSEEALQWMERDSLHIAEAKFREALKLQPTNPHNALLFSNIGLIQQRQRRYDDALESFNLALNIAPNAIPILLNRGAICMETGNLSKAYMDYCHVLDFDKENTEALLMRAYIYIIRRDYKAARVDYIRLLQLEPTNYSGLLGLVTVNQKEKKYSEAIEILNNLLVEHPQDATLYMMRAGVEEERGQVDSALLDLEEVIRLDSTLPDPYLLRGEIYLSQKKKTQAKQDFEKAIALGIPQADLRELLLQCK